MRQRDGYELWIVTGRKEGGSYTASPRETLGVVSSLTNRFVVLPVSAAMLLNDAGISQTA